MPSDILEDAAAAVEVTSAISTAINEHAGLSSGVHGVLAPSGGDDGAIIQAIIDAAILADATALIRIKLGPGTYNWQTTPLIPPSGKGFILEGFGMYATTIVATSTAKALLSPARTGNHQTFQKIRVVGLTFDCANQSGFTHTILGNRRDDLADWTKYVNWDTVEIGWVRTINCPFDAVTQGRIHISLVCRQDSGNTGTLNTAKNIWLHDLKLEGGNAGYGVHGSGPTPTNALVDNFVDERVKWDSLTTPSANGTGGNQIGGVGRCGRVRITNGSATGSPDVGWEIDAAHDLVMVGCVAKDCRQENFLIRNFAAPDDQIGQRNLLVGCEAISENIDPSSTLTSRHFMVGGDATTSDYVFGAVELVNCKSRFRGPLANLSSNGLSFYASGVQAKHIIIRDLTISASSIATVLTANQTSSFVDINLANTDATVSIDGIKFQLAGTRAGAFTHTLRFARLNGANLRAWIKRVRVTNAVTGYTSANDTHNIVSLGDLKWDGTNNSTIRAKIDDCSAQSYVGGGATVHGVNVATSSTLTIPQGSRIVATGCDFSGATASTGLDYNLNSSGSVRLQFVARDIVGQRVAGGSGPIFTRTSISVTGSPFTFDNTEPVEVDVTVSGGTVSLIEISYDASNFEALTGMTGGTFRLAPHQELRVTYSVAPTMIRAPVR